MRTMIFIALALLSMSVSAQTNETKENEIPKLYGTVESLYDYVERILLKPLEEKGIEIYRSEETISTYNKTVYFDIPQIRFPRVSPEERGKICQIDSADLSKYIKCTELNEILFDALNLLKSEASEVYWWDKKSDDSLLVSMAWDASDTISHRNYTNSEGHREMFGATYMHVNNYGYNKRSGLSSPRCYTHVFFQCMIDTIAAGTEFFNAEAFCKHVAPTLSNKRIAHHPFKCHYTKDFVDNEEVTGKKNISWHKKDYYNTKSEFNITGEVYIIPKDIAETTYEEFTAAMQTYLDANHEQAYARNPYIWKNVEWGLMGSLPLLGTDSKLRNEQTKFDVYTKHPIDDGSLMIAFVRADGEMVLPKKYWKVKTANNEKVEYIKQPVPTPSKGSKDANDIYNNVDVTPSFPGGMPELVEYIRTNLHYPPIGIMNDVLADTQVSFVVEPDGSISEDNIDVSKIKVYYKDSAKGEFNSQDPDNESLIASFKNAAKQVVSQMPKWTPGKQKGRNVRTRMSLPINFRLE